MKMDLKKTRPIVFGSLLILAFNVFVLSPLISKNLGIVSGNIFYILVRILVLGTLAFALIRWAGKSRYQALTLVALIAFLDQVGFKFLTLYYDAQAHPESWPGFGVLPIFHMLAMGYMSFLPVILVIAFAGVLIAQKSAKPTPL